MFVRIPTFASQIEWDGGLKLRVKHGSACFAWQAIAGKVRECLSCFGTRHATISKIGRRFNNLVALSSFPLVQEVLNILSLDNIMHLVWISLIEGWEAFSADKKTRKANPASLLRQSFHQDWSVQNMFPMRLLLAVLFLLSRSVCLIDCACVCACVCVW